MSFKTIRKALIEELIPEERPLFSVNKSDKISKVFSVLSENNVHGLFVLVDSVPVGWVDIYDLTVYLAYSLKQSGDLSDVDIDEFAASSGLFDATAGDVMSFLDGSDGVDLSTNNEFFVVRLDQKLKEVIDYFYGRKHRLAVANTEGTIVNVVSQLDLVIYMIDNNRRNGDFVSSTYVKVADCEWVNRNVVTVHKNIVLMDALLLCLEKQVNATGIVDDEGKIIGNLSTRDLINITDRNIRLLKLTIHDYLSQEGKTLRTPIVVNNNHLLEKVFKQVSKHRVHRVYVVNDDQIPVGIISLTDLIRYSVNVPSHE